VRSGTGEGLQERPACPFQIMCTLADTNGAFVVPISSTPLTFTVSPPPPLDCASPVALQLFASLRKDGPLSL
jgi:hypothetical protein